MQGTEYYEANEDKLCIQDWLNARDKAVDAALDFRFPVTKQLRNRLLEPFMWHKVILSATEFENFFALRAHKDAEIHIAELAYKMLEAYNASEPKYLNEGDWHIPFGDKINEDRLFNKYLNDAATYPQLHMISVDDAKKKIAIARCARVSYNNFEGKDDYEADIKLCDRLFGGNPKHLSPTEHVAQAQNNSDWSGNYRGFKQYRKMFDNENLSDPRVIQKFKPNVTS